MVNYVGFIVVVVVWWCIINEKDEEFILDEGGWGFGIIENGWVLDEVGRYMWRCDLGIEVGGGILRVGVVDGLYVIGVREEDLYCEVVDLEFVLEDVWSMCLL